MPSAEGSSQAGWRYNDRCLKVYWDSPKALQEVRKATAKKKVRNLSKWIVRVVDEHLHGALIPKQEHERLQAELDKVREEAEAAKKLLDAARAEVVALTDEMMRQEMYWVKKENVWKSNPAEDIR